MASTSQNLSRGTNKENGGHSGCSGLYAVSSILGTVKM